jgi:hypothetical protein
VARLIHDLNEELAQSIYTLLCEDLFIALLRKPDVKGGSKRRRRQLISIWDDSTLEIDDFAPILESAWHARNRITSDFGCLVGATETFRLVCEDCSSEVLEFFGRDGMTEPETQAFEEFLFNMTWEELNTCAPACAPRASRPSARSGPPRARPPHRRARALARDRPGGAVPLVQPPPARRRLPLDGRRPGPAAHRRGLPDGAPARVDIKRGSFEKTQVEAGGSPS